MQSNEQGLAKEEKVMFIILGIILLVSIGVLIINYFSNFTFNKYIFPPQGFDAVMLPKPGK